MTAPRLAVNALPYWSRDGKSQDVFAQAFADFAAIGYAAVKADVPDGMTPAEYLDWISGYGLAPAVSLSGSTGPRFSGCRALGRARVPGNLNPAG